MLGLLSRSASSLDDGPLSPQAALRRAFGGMAIFISLSMLGLGGYFIRDQFADPVASHPASLLFAAVLIASGLVLLSYLIHPGATQQPRSAAQHERPAITQTIEIPVTRSLEMQQEKPEFAISSRYVDQTRIRP